MKTCAACGTTLVPIVYGYPGPDLFEKEEQGEVLLGGCVIDDDAPAFGCPNTCGQTSW